MREGTALLDRVGGLFREAYLRMHRAVTLLRFGGDSEKAKQRYELAYWEGKKVAEGVLSHSHYEYFFTTHFSLEPSFFQGVAIMDVGCGPRGSLEWASRAAVRVGLDPLCDAYRGLGTDSHQMRYVAARSEQIPFRDGCFDVVSSFNSLDHVEDLDRTIAEIVRVLNVGGTFLLLVEVHPQPTLTEPITFSWEIVERFAPTLQCRSIRRFQKHPSGVYESVMMGTPCDPGCSAEQGILSAKFTRVRY